MPSNPVLPAAAICITLACAPPEDAPRRDSGEAPDPGVVVHEASAWQQLPVIAVDSAPVVTIGDGALPGHDLRAVVDATIAGNLLLIADDASAEVRAFDLSGRLVRRYGGRGRDQGATESIRAMQVTGDTLLIFDGAGRRMHVYSLGGARLTTISLVLAPEVRFRMPDGSLAGIAPGGEVPDSATGVRRASAHVLHRPDASGQLDTLATFLADEAWVAPGAGGNVSWILPFGRMPAVLFGGQHAVITCERDFGFRLAPWDGGDELQVRIDIAPRRVTEVDVARYRDAWGSWSARRDRAFALRFGTLPRDIFFRRAIPECAGGRLASNGRIWIAEYTILNDVPREWTVFEPDGALVGRVRTPAGFRLTAIAGAHIVAVRGDAGGGERVVVFASPLPN